MVKNVGRREMKVRTLQPSTFPKKLWNREGTVLRTLTIEGNIHSVIKLDNGGELLGLRETEYEEVTVDLIEMVKWVLNRYEEGTISKKECEYHIIKMVSAFIIETWGKEEVTK